MFKVKLLYKDSKAPTKAHSDDSGWDLYAHSFKEVWVGANEEYVIRRDEAAGLIPGAQVGDTLHLNPMERVVVGLGIAGYIDVGGPIMLQGIDFLLDLNIVPRSGNRRKEGLEVHFGTIDVSYRGELMAIVTNLGNQARTLKLGDRIVQVAPRLVPMVGIDIVEELDDTVRGSSGFGDSGKR